MRKFLLVVGLVLPWAPLFSDEPPSVREMLIARFPTREAYLESVGAEPLTPVDLVVAWDVHRVATTAFANRVYNALFYVGRRPESLFYTCHPAVQAGGGAGERHLIPLPFLALLENGPRLDVVDRTAPDHIVGRVAASGRVEMLVPLDLEVQGSEVIYDPYQDVLLQLTPAPLVLPHPFPGESAPVSGLTIHDPAGEPVAGARLEVGGANPIMRNIGYLRDEWGLAHAVMRMGAPERVIFEDLRTKPGWLITAFTVAFPRAIYRLDPRHLRIEDGKLVRVAAAGPL